MPNTVSIDRPRRPAAPPMTAIIERLRDLLGQQYAIERELPGGGMSRVHPVCRTMADADAELQPAVEEVRQRMAELSGEQN